MVEYTLTENNLHIVDSYKVRKWNMRKELNYIKNNDPTLNIVFVRCTTSLILEWICHNFLYRIGYQRERTKDADLDNPCDHPEWMYIACGIGIIALELLALIGLVWLFVWLI